MAIPQKTTDPFLLAHLVHPLMFDIGGGLSPVSIRDQMLRGYLIVERAKEQGLIDVDRPLLVIGAGPAGATAAILAAKHKIKTLLIEKEKNGFTRQRGCLSRWVNPTQYDWPLPHWDREHYHWTPPDVPLPWKAAPANILAIRWQRQLSDAVLANSPFLAVRYRTELEEFFLVKRKLPLPEVDYQIETTLNKGRERLRFGMVISCVGFGSEGCTVGDYSSYKFWDMDEFEKTDLGLPFQPRILISGGGDGALQDFLRIMTKPLKQEPASRGRRRRFFSADTIIKELDNDATIQPELADVVRVLQGAEDQAQRAHIWGNHKGQDHNPLMQLHQVYEKQVERLWLAVRSELVAVLDPIVKNPTPDLKLVYPCRHFSKCYGLNRFLVLLVNKYLMEERASDHLKLGQGVTQVASNDLHVHPTCDNNPSTCFGKRHDVTIKPMTCRPDIPSPAPIRYEIYDVVIIRHGIKEPSYFFGKAPVPNPRHMLPYHAPDSV